MTEQHSGSQGGQHDAEHDHGSSDSVHKRGDVTRSHGGEHGTPEQTQGGVQPRGEHPVDPAEGARDAAEE